MSDILRVKEKADIVDVISSYFELSSAGKSFKGRCPFHNEKSPSFFVSPERQNYYCFGCGAKGDVLNFVEQYESLDFLGALKLLADRFGVVLEGGQKVYDDTSRLYAIMEEATMFFETELVQNSEALLYIKNRGLSDPFIKEWRIGYAKDDWRVLHDYLLSKKFTIAEMKDAGLVRDIEKSSRSIDLFRNRIMFPIRDITGRVIAFSGRTLSKETGVPKYVNSPETHIFRKSNVLFGLYEAKQAIRKTGYSILVEGQLDVLLLHERGLRNTVASSGTAFTIEQANVLKRISPNLVLLYDGDTAGRAASLRSAEIALGIQVETKIARVPAGVDPADLALENHELLKEVLQKADHAIFVAARMILDEESRPERRVALIVKDVLPLVLRIETRALQEHFVQELARMCGVSKDSLWRDLNLVFEKGAQTSAAEVGRASPVILSTEDSETRLLKIFRRLSGVINWLEPDVQKKELIESTQQNIDRIFSAMEEEEKNNFIERVRDESNAFEAERMYGTMSETALKEAIGDLIKNLNLEVLRKTYSEATDPEKKFFLRKEIDTLQAT